MVMLYPRVFQHTHHPQVTSRLDPHVFTPFQPPIGDVTAHIADGGETFVLEGPTLDEWIATDTTAEVVR